MKSYDRAAGAYLEAWNLKPNRAEPLYRIAKMYREQGKSNLAMMFALQGKKIPFPEEERLFVEYNVYVYLFDEEISISAFYVPGMENRGTIAIKKLLEIRNKLPKDTFNLVIDNLKYYLKLSTDNRVSIIINTLESLDSNEDLSENILSVILSILEKYIKDNMIDV